MSRRKTRAVVLAMVTLVVTSACEAGPIDPEATYPPSFTSTDRPARPAVTGHAEFTRDFPGVGAVTIRYSIHAVSNGRGGAGGTIEFRAQGLEFPLDERWHGTVRCLTVDTDGRTARVGGRIDGTSRDVGFVLQDNGEGSGAAPDLASPAGPRPDDPVRGAFEHCRGETLPLPLTAIDRGGIRVRP